MSTYNFEQKFVNLGDSMVVKLTVQKHIYIYRDPKHHIETNLFVYVANQLTGFYMSPGNTVRSL